MPDAVTGLASTVYEFICRRPWEPRQSQSLFLRPALTNDMICQMPRESLAGSCYSRTDYLLPTMGASRLPETLTWLLIDLRDFLRLIS